MNSKRQQINSSRGMEKRVDAWVVCVKEIYEKGRFN